MDISRPPHLQFRSRPKPSPELAQRVRQRQLRRMQPVTRRPVADMVRPSAIRQSIANARVRVQRKPIDIHANILAKLQAKARLRTRQNLSREPSVKKISTIVVLGSVILGSLAVFWVTFGQIVLGVYAIAALWRRYPSRQTFGLALVMFAGIVLTSMLEPFRYLADNLAIYAFLLLGIGTLSLALETRRDMRQTSAN